MVRVPYSGIKVENTIERPACSDPFVDRLANCFTVVGKSILVSSIWSHGPTEHADSMLVRALNHLLHAKNQIVGRNLLYGPLIRSSGSVSQLPRLHVWPADIIDPLE